MERGWQRCGHCIEDPDQTHRRPQSTKKSQGILHSCGNDTPTPKGSHTGKTSEGGGKVFLPISLPVGLPDLHFTAWHPGPRGLSFFFFFSLTPSRVTVTVSYKDGILRPKTFSTSLVYQDHSWVKPHNPKDILDILEGHFFFFLP